MVTRPAPSTNYFARTTTPQEIEEVRREAANIDGFSSDAEGELLYRFAKNCSGKGVIVEIGSWKGKPMYWLARASIRGDNVRIFSVDSHDDGTLPVLQETVRVAGAEHLVTHIVMHAHKAAPLFQEPIELLFVDAGTEYSGVRGHFDNWFPKVIDGGMMVWQDTQLHNGAFRVVVECMFLTRRFKNMGFIDSIVYGQKTNRNGLKDVARNIYVLTLKLLYGAVAEIPWPTAIRTLLKTLGRGVAARLQR